MPHGQPYTRGEGARTEMAMLEEEVCRQRESGVRRRSIGYRLRGDCQRGWNRHSDYARKRGGDV